MKNNRILYYDALRGLAIIMVIGIHTYKIDYTSQFEILIRNLLNTAVPLFLSISGYFVVKSTKSTLKKILRVYIPTLIWSTPYLILTLSTKESSFLLELVKFFFCGYSVYYFILLIIQYYLLLPIFRRSLTVSWTGIKISFLISMISVVLITFLMNYLKYSWPLVVYAGPFVLWIVFFHLGCFMKQKQIKSNLFLWIVIASLFLLFSVVESNFWLFKFNKPSVGVKLSSFIFSFAFIIILFNDKIISFFNKRSFLLKILSEMGKLSFGIYLTHCFFIIFFTKFQLDFNWISMFSLVLIFDSLFVYIMNKILPFKGSKYILGV